MNAISHLAHNTNGTRVLYSVVGIFVAVVCCFTVKLVSVKVPVSIEMFVNCPFKGV